ncbi:hypothetical protein, partial [Rhodopirellula sp. MGV]|uniref:hypothetical protein n=1 Tax=Rhodopirellula sp. MGV TaxID=2023130 RepID=UPI000BD3C16D
MTSRAITGKQRFRELLWATFERSIHAVDELLNHEVREAHEEEMGTTMRRWSELPARTTRVTGHARKIVHFKNAASRAPVHAMVQVSRYAAVDFGKQSCWKEWFTLNRSAHSFHQDPTMSKSN